MELGRSDGGLRFYEGSRKFADVGSLRGLMRAKELHDRKHRGRERSRERFSCCLQEDGGSIVRVDPWQSFILIRSGVDGSDL